MSRRRNRKYSKEQNYAGLYEDDFLKEVIGHSRQAEETERRLKEKERKSLLARDDELDGLFERIYEDNVSGKLSDDRFAKMSRRYEEEQKELSEKIKKLRSEIEKQSSRATSTDMFVSIVRKYTRARKLTPRMLNELVEKIEVYNAEKIDGEWVQRLRIHYNCVGEIAGTKFQVNEQPHPLQLRGGNEHSQRTGTAHPGRHRQHRKRRVRELHDRRQTRCLSRKKRVSSQLFKCCKNTRHGAGNRT